MIILNVENHDDILNKIRKIIDDSKLDGGVSLTENNDISVKVFAYNSDKLIDLSNQISHLIIKA